MSPSAMTETSHHADPGETMQGQQQQQQPSSSPTADSVGSLLGKPRRRSVRRSLVRRAAPRRPSQPQQQILERVGQLNLSAPDDDDDADRRASLKDSFDDRRTSWKFETDWDAMPFDASCGSHLDAAQADLYHTLDDLEDLEEEQDDDEESSSEVEGGGDSLRSSTKSFPGKSLHELLFEDDGDGAASTSTGDQQQQQGMPPTQDKRGSVASEGGVPPRRRPAARSTPLSRSLNSGRAYAQSVRMMLERDESSTTFLRGTSRGSSQGDISSCSSASMGGTEGEWGM